MSALERKGIEMELSRRQTVTLVVILFGTFVTVLNQTLVTPALPSIMSEMSINAATGQWLTTGFTLVNAIMIPITAYLQDRFSVKKLFMFSMTVFVLGSLLCGWGPNFITLLSGRLVQAVGAGILMPMSMTVLLVTFPVSKRGSAMGLFGLVIACAPAIGPTVAGIMIDTVDWHVMFYVVTALAGVVAVLAAVLIEQQKPATSADSSLDPLSVVLSTLGFGGVLLGFSSFGSSGLSPVSIVSLAIGIVGVVWFFIRQTRLEKPMLRVEVLRNKRFLIATIIGMLVQASLLVAPVLMPIYVQDLMGYSATVSGLVIMPGAIIMAIVNPIAGKIFDKRGPRALSIIGMVTLTLTTFAFGILDLQSSIFIVTLLFTTRFFSMALVNMPITTWGMNALDTKLMNHATSINNTLRQVAGSIGTAFVVSIYTTMQQRIGGPNPPLEASMQAFNFSFVICGVLVAIGLVLTIVFVKGRPATIRDKDLDRDLVRDGENLGSQEILLSRIMKRDVFVLHGEDTVKDAMELFINEGISACPIVDKTKEPIGFISDGDILKKLARNTQSFLDPVALIATTVEDKQNYDEKLEELMGKPVLSVGKRNVISVNIHESIDEVCRVLAENHLKKVPVMDDGKICGIINRSDITRYSMEAYLEGRPNKAAYCEAGDGCDGIGAEEGS